MKKITLSLFATLITQPVFAQNFDQEFYTYGGFQQTVDAFKRVALYYGADYGWTIGIFIAGLIAAAAVSAAQTSSSQLSGQGGGSTFLASLMFSIIGVGAFSVGVIPKGTIHVYDAKNNQYEPVAGVPAIIAVSAGALSSITEAVRDTENTANAYPYGELSDGSPFVLITTAVENTRLAPTSLVDSLSAMYSDCGSSAIASGRLDIEELKSGTYDLLSTLEGLRHHAIETTLYTPSNPSGQAATCAEAFTYVEDGVRDQGTYEKQLKQICSRIGLDVSSGGDRATCLDRLGDAFDIMYASGEGQVDAHLGLANLLIGEVLSSALANSSGPDAIHIQLSRNGLAESIGVMEGNARFFPLMKSVLFSSILGTAPILFIFLLTPLLGKALKTWFGLLIFYGIWQISDMVALSSIEDSLHAAVGHLVANKMGLVAIWTTQTELLDAFSLLAKTRTGSLTIAVMLTAMLVGISAFGLSGMASKIEGDLEKDAGEAGKDSLLTERSGQVMEGIASGNANWAAMAGNPSAATRSAAFDTATNIQAGNMTADSFGGVGAAAGAVAADRSASVVGGAMATESEGYEGAVDSARINTEGGFSQTAAVEEAAKESGQNTRDYQGDTSTMNESRTAGKLAELQKGDGVGDNAFRIGQDEGAEKRAVSDEVKNKGTDPSYDASMVDHKNKIQSAAAVLDATGDNPDSFLYENPKLRTLNDMGEISAAENYTDEELIKVAEGDSSESISQSLARTNLAEGNDSNRTDMGENLGVITASTDLASIELREGLKSDLSASDLDIGRATLGEQDYTLSKDLAENAFNADILNPAQWNAIDGEGGGVLRMAAFGDGEGGLSIQSTAVTSSGSTEVDKSVLRNNEVVHEHSTGSMNENSSRVMLADGDKLEKWADDTAHILNPRQMATEVGAMASQALSPYITATEGDSSIGSNELFLRASLGTPGAFTAATGVSIEGGTNNTKTDMAEKSRVEDSISPHFANVWNSVYSHHLDGGETEDSARERTAETFADYFDTFSGNMSTGEIDEFNRTLFNGSLDNVWDDYADSKGLYIDLLHREQTMPEKEGPTMEEQARARIMEDNEQYGNTSDRSVDFSNYPLNPTGNPDHKGGVTDYMSNLDANNPSPSQEFTAAESTTSEKGGVADYMSNLDANNPPPPQLPESWNTRPSYSPSDSGDYWSGGKGEIDPNSDMPVSDGESASQETTPPGRAE